MGVAGDFRQEQSKYSLNAIVALIAALFILFIGVLVLGIVQARYEAQRSAESRADAASQVVATNTKWIVELARQALQRIDYAVGDDFVAVQAPAVQNIADAVESLPGSVKAYVVDANGNTIYSTDPNVKAINITDREYFSVPAAGQLWYTSSLLVSRLNGDQIFVFSKRLVRGGKFAGVAIVSFNVALFSEIWASLGLDKEFDRQHHSRRRPARRPIPACRRSARPQQIHPVHGVFAQEPVRRLFRGVAGRRRRALCRLPQGCRD